MLKRKQNDKPKLPPFTSGGNGQRRQHAEARRRLPVARYRSEICSLVKENDVVLVVAETVSMGQNFQTHFILYFISFANKFTNHTDF